MILILVQRDLCVIQSRRRAAVLTKFDGSESVKEKIGVYILEFAEPSVKCVL